MEIKEIIPVDIGNSKLKLKFNNEIFSFSNVRDIDFSKFLDIKFIISSVNNKLKNDLIKILEAKLIEYLVLDISFLKTIDLNFKIDLKKFKTTGIDRILDTFIGVKKYGFSILVIDMGTANTYNFVNENGEFQGGIITPGVDTRLKSLNKNTSNLPSSKLIDKPFGVMHYKTEKAINSGVYFGQLGELKELISMFKTKTVIFTGGCSGYFYNFIQLNGYRVINNLILDAIEDIYSLSKK